MTSFVKKFQLILEPDGCDHTLVFDVNPDGCTKTTIRSIIDQIDEIKDTLTNPEKYNIIWMSGGVKQVVDPDTEVHIESDKYKNPLFLYCYSKSTCNVDIDITCQKIYSDDGQFNDKHMLKTAVKLPDVIMSQHHLIQSLANSLCCTPESILAIYEEDSPLEITGPRIIEKGMCGDPFQFMTVQVSKSVIIPNYANHMRKQFDALIETFKSNLESLI
jgi:hypothetical protein